MSSTALRSLRSIRVGVDLMGSDQPPQAIFEAVLQISQETDASITLVVFATTALHSDLQNQLLAFYQTFPKVVTRIESVQCDDVIEMDDAPLLAVRRKRKSTMAVGIRMLKTRELDAFLSTGNTGALVASARLYLPRLKGIDRPALLVRLPTENGGVTVLDVGANTLAKPQHLIEFAELGAKYVRHAHNLKTPRIGLLNIGVEEQKGTKELKETYTLLKKRFPDQFMGNIEGREVYQGKIDLLVTDGFTGNVFLKTSEGVSRFLIEYLRRHFPAQTEIVSHLYHQFNYSEHPGAFLCGVDGVIVKCHGHSDALALMNGIRGAIALARNDILKKIKADL